MISWNVNGLRACIKKGFFFEFLRQQRPQILAMQETKLGRLDIDTTTFSKEGYDVEFFSAQKPGYSGVGLAVSKGLEYEVIKGIGIKDFDSEGRVIQLLSEDMVFINAYFPNSQEGGRRLDYKIAFCDAMKSYLDDLNKKAKNILLCGDYNIAHTEIDLANPKANEDSPGFLPEERAWMDKFLSKDYIDTFRMFTKDPGHYTWWSYRTNARSRNVGWRIDYHCVNLSMKSRVKKSFHNTEVLGSDHCPVTIIMD